MRTQLNQIKKQLLFGQKASAIPNWYEALALLRPREAQKEHRTLLITLQDTNHPLLDKFKNFNSAENKYLELEPTGGFYRVGRDF